MDQNNWAEKEFETVDLGDVRLNQRLIKMSQDFLKAPESHINKACGDWSETKAAYRFFQNDNVDYHEVIDSHAQSTIMRSTNDATILAIQDTTYFNFSNHPKTKELGVLTRFKGKHKNEILTMGLCMHTTLGLTVDGLPLGILSQNIYAREKMSSEKMELKKRSHNNALPIEEKESIRWLNSMEETINLFNGSIKRVITIADREADIYEFFQLANKLNTDLLVRASHNRKINRSAIHSEISGEYLWDFMNDKKHEGTVKVKVPKKGKNPERWATCQVKFSKINVLPSRKFIGPKDEELHLELYAIQILELNQPKESEPIEWMLLTTIPIHTLQEAIEKMKWYCLRWRIEIYFKVLKSGFKVEDCRLQTADRLIRYLAVMSVVAWQVYWLTLVSRTAPEITSDIFLSDFEWKILFTKFNPNKKIPKQHPTMKQITIWIARLGGFLARKGDGEPGVTHIWRGLQKFNIMIEGAEMFRNICG